MAIGKVPHPTLEERHEAGKAARERTPRLSHEAWVPADDRPDPVALLVEQDESREQDLVPVRHGRMMVSPFTFYRGAADSVSNSAATPTCRTSACTPRPNGPCCST
jgi:hypothetical protein